MKKNMTNSLDPFIQRQVKALIDLWENCDQTAVIQSPLVPLEKKLKNERVLSQQLEWLTTRFDHPIWSDEEKSSFQLEMKERIQVAASEILGMNEAQMGYLGSVGLTSTSQEFYRRAREFNPFIGFDEIFQANRNVWASHYLQTLLGIPVEITPSLFAYSMLYPVSDNYLDDPKISRVDKIAFNHRFRDWLRGEGVAPQNANERDVYDLVRMVETQYCRADFPKVYDSLLAIHAAQDKNMRLARQSTPCSLNDILSSTFEKGGTSVLADGFLVAGDLTDEQMQAIFNFGAFAQLLDDQEDLPRDLKEHNRTLFTEAAKSGKVDQTLNRMFNFAHSVLRGMNAFSQAGTKPLQQISISNIDLLMINAMSQTARFYSSEYLQGLEWYFPFRFKFANKIGRRASKRGITLERLSGILNSEQQSTSLLLAEAVF